MGGPCLVDGTMRPELDNFLQCAFELDGKQWTSAEQYFQAVKFTDESYREKIRACHDGGPILCTRPRRCAMSCVFVVW